MNTRKKVLGIARPVLSVLSAVTAVAVPTANAQPSRIPPGSDSIAFAIVARGFIAQLHGPMPEYAHYIDELQIGDGPPMRMEVFMAKPDKILVRGGVLGQVTLEWGFDGTTGWHYTPDIGVTTLAGRELDALRASVRTPLGAGPVSTDMRLVHGGKVMFEGEFTDLVFSIDADGDTTEVYYAVSSGLLSAMLLPREKGRRGRSMTFYRDYTLFGGSMIAATRTELLSTGIKMVTRMVYSSTDPIPDETFRRPTAPPSP